MVSRNRVDKVQVLRNALESGGNGRIMTNSDRALVREAVTNATLMRSELLSKLIDDRRDIDDECGYPKTITSAQYKLMYDREGVATRVVNVFPEESWGADPEVVETEDPDETPFEEAFADLELKNNVWSHLFKVDEQSGIGRFGVLLLGIDDGKALDQPVEGINERGEKTGEASHQLIFMRSFDETLVDVDSVEGDRKNPRYGKPVMYSITFDTSTEPKSDSGSIGVASTMNTKVHWTRVIHVADNRRSSEVYGTPRMQSLFNRLYDLRKIVGGSGEMFWKGGFPGYSFQMDSNARPLSDPQKEALRDEIAAYANGLQRYLSVQGVDVKSLSPQMADPRGHVEAQYNYIAIALGVPIRIFMGSERGELASGQDQKAWNTRITRRSNKYLTPYVIRPFIDRMIAFGVLPEPAEENGYNIVWPDMDAPSEKDKAEVMGKIVEAFAKYVGGNVDALVPPEIFLTMFANLNVDEVKEIMDAAMEREEELETEREEEEMRAAAEAEEAEEVVEPEPEA